MVFWVLFFLMIGLKNIDVINLSHFPAIPFISMPSFRSSFSLSYWKFQVKLSYLKGEFITFDSHTHTHIHTLSFYLSLPLSLLNFYDFHCKEIRSFGKNPNYNLVPFSSVQSLSCVRHFATPWMASLSITNSQSSLKLTSIESVMPSSHLILCRPLLL